MNDVMIFFSPLKDKFLDFLCGPQIFDDNIVLNLNPALVKLIEEGTVELKVELAEMQAMYGNDGSIFRPSFYLGSRPSPDIYDYIYFAFCYYMLTVFLVTMFLIYVVDLILKNSETKILTKETRGFSRAQTGDAITAVIPLTWSLSMVIHASSNSSNFDENTDNTAMILNVIAYQ